MASTRRPRSDRLLGCLIAVTAALAWLGVATPAGAQQSPRYEKSGYDRPAARRPAPSLLSKEVLLAPWVKLHDGTKKLHASTMAFNRKVYGGTKKFFVQTASYLSPSNLLPKKKPASRYGSGSWAPRKKKRGAADWLIPSWLKPEEPRPSKTIDGFLSQPRLDY